MRLTQSRVELRRVKLLGIRGSHCLPWALELKALVPEAYTKRRYSKNCRSNKSSTWLIGSETKNPWVCLLSTLRFVFLRPEYFKPAGRNRLLANGGFSGLFIGTSILKQRKTRVWIPGELMVHPLKSLRSGFSNLISPQLEIFCVKTAIIWMKPG